MFIWAWIVFGIQTGYSQAQFLRQAQDELSYNSLELKPNSDFLSSSQSQFELQPQPEPSSRV